MYQRSALSLETAMKGLEAMLIEAAKDPNHRYAVAIADDRGEIIIFARQDGCSQFHNEMAIKLASEAAEGFNTRNPDRRKGWEKEGIDHTMFARGTKLVMVGGGVPVLKPGEEAKGGHKTRISIGGIGTSGAGQDENERLSLFGANFIKDILWAEKGE